MNQHVPSESLGATTIFKGRDPVRVDSVTGSDIRPFDMGTRHTPSVGQGSLFAPVTDNRVQESPISMVGVNVPEDG